MKRRSFIKGLVALALAPVAAVASTSTPAKPLDHVVNKGVLKDLYVSPEAMEDIRNWCVDSIDEDARKEILRDGWDIQPFHGKSDSADDLVEIKVGLDNTTKPNRNGDIFVMPERDELETYTPGLQDTEVNEELFELGREELRFYTEQGCAILDNRRVLLAEF
jgi:hypothetical protein